MCIKTLRMIWHRMLRGFVILVSCPEGGSLRFGKTIQGLVFFLASHIPLA
jgi:hypothetical protein